MNSWEMVPLEELGKITSSKQIFKSEYVDEGIPFYRTKEIKELANGKKVSTELYISKDKFNEINQKFGVPAIGDLLMTAIGTIGEIYVVDNINFYFKDGNVLWLKDFKEMSPDFLKYALIAFVDELNSLSHGSTYNALPIEKLKKHKILKPPLIEQKRIVSIVDEAFEAIDIAIDNTRQNLTNARELFDSYLNAIFTQKGDGWVERKLGDIATLRNGINFTKNSTGESIRIVGVKDFQDNFWMQENGLEFVKVDGELKEIDTLNENDILTVRSNGSKELIGRCILVGNLSEKTSHSGFTIRIRIERKDIYPPFIVHFLKSKELRKQLTASGGGISISSINQQGLSLIELSFPVAEKQKFIVASIDELAVETQRLEAIYRQKLAALNELKQSILHKAFTGELTADQADLMTNIEPEAIAV